MVLAGRDKHFIIIKKLARKCNGDNEGVKSSLLFYTIYIVYIFFVILHYDTKHHTHNIKHYTHNMNHYTYKMIRYIYDTITIYYN